MWLEKRSINLPVPIGVLERSENGPPVTGTGMSNAEKDLRKCQELAVSSCFGDANRRLLVFAANATRNFTERCDRIGSVSVAELSSDYQ